MTVTKDDLRKGQVVKFRRYPRRPFEYMRLLDYGCHISDDGTFVRLYGYKTRADGTPTRIHPTVRTQYAAEVEVVSRPGQ
jgi:hypothetical protein